jgi:predicted dehydrogenase
MHKFALVGAGVIGKHHGTVIEQLADRIELVAVADIVPERAEELTARHGGRPYPSLTEAMAAEAVDVVVVCTPTGLHGEVAIEALNAGKHVIVEKPAEITVARTDEIIEAQRKAGTLVTVISQHRFDPATETTPSPAASWAGSPRASPRSTGGAGRPTTTPATGAAPGTWTAAAR